MDLSERFGGASTRVISLLRELPADSIALAALFNSPVAQEAQKTGRRLHILATGKSDPRILLHLIRVVRERGYQILDTQNIQSKFWASVAVLLTRTALISTLNSWCATEHAGNSWKGNLYLWLEFLTNWNLTRTIVVSRKIHSALLKRGFDPHRVDLIYNAVSLDSQSVPDMRNELLHEYGIPSDAVICLAAGRLVPVKGYTYLVEAIARLKESLIYCFIIGNGELKDTLESQIRNVGLEAKIRLLGFAPHEQTLALIKACDIFVMPPLHEGTPVALLEAAALARPIILDVCCLLRR